ncbi:alpha/beta fold hydrolase [Streptomyces griseus]|uniref:alpha/beta fold hydrolase n=1 Tax=Streptomyces griseus TaxID=1911 RepID=UPI0022770C8E|nr:alpha/beta hydrolase [Streptomyces griseus]
MPRSVAAVEAPAAVVAEWLPGVGLTRPAVVGNSLGGAVALELARICAVGSAVALSPIGLWTRAEAAYALSFARPWRIPQETAAGALRNLARSPGFEPTRRSALAYRLRALTPAVPVTVGWGTRDLMAPPHQVLRAARLLPGARHVSLKGCGHSPMSDDPEQVTSSGWVGSGSRPRPGSRGCPTPWRCPHR